MEHGNFNLTWAQLPVSVGVYGTVFSLYCAYRGLRGTFNRHSKDALIALFLPYERAFLIVWIAAEYPTARWIADHAIRF